MLLEEFAELNDELIRMKEMDYYKFHSYLNGLQEIFQQFENKQDPDSESVEYARKSIRLFMEIYGNKNEFSEDLRKNAQDLIIDRNWHYN